MHERIREHARQLSDELRRWKLDNGSIPTGKPRRLIEGYLFDLFSEALDSWHDLDRDEQGAVEGIHEALRGTRRDWLYSLEVHRMNEGGVYPRISATCLTRKSHFDRPAADILPTVLTFADSIAAPVAEQVASKPKRQRKKKREKLSDSESDTLNWFAQGYSRAEIIDWSKTINSESSYHAQIARIKEIGPQLFKQADKLRNAQNGKSDAPSTSQKSARIRSMKHATGQ